MDKIKENGRIKILALIAAFFLWSFVISNENPTVTRWVSNVPVTFENADKLTDRGLSIIDDYTKTTSVQISGKRNQLVNVTNQSIRQYADVGNLSEGTRNVKMSYDVPDGVSVVNANEGIELKVERIIKKDINIFVDQSGEMQENFILHSISPTPQKITISGPRSLVERVNKVLAKVDISSFTRDVVTNVKLMAVDVDGITVNGVELGQGFANISASVYKIKTVDIVDRSSDDLAQDYKIVNKTVDPNKILIKGTEAAVDVVNSVFTKEYSLKDVTGSKEIPLELDLPSGISLVQDQVKVMAKLEIEAKEIRDIQLKTADIKVTGLAEGKTVKFSKDSYNVKVKCFKDEFENLNFSDLQASLNITDETVKSMKPEIKNEKGIEIVSSEDVTFEIE